MTAQLWMIRKSNNHLVGPLAANQVVEMVEQGLLDPDDELCPENGYWFTLSEVDEVKRYLGLRDVFIRKTKGLDGESTQGDNTAADDTHDTLTGDVPLAEGVSGDVTAMITLPPRTTPLTQAKVNELQATPALTGEELAKRYARPASAIIGFPTGEQTSEAPRVERSRVWIMVVVLGLGALAWGTYRLFQLLNHP